MARRKDALEVLKSQGVKALRSAVRLKHSMAAEVELNEVIPEFEERYDRLLLQGQLLTRKEINQMVAEVLDEAA